MGSLAVASVIGGYGCVCSSTVRDLTAAKVPSIRMA